MIRHAQAEDGPELQTDRDLTSVGEAQLPVMARFLKTQTDKIGLVLCSSDLLRGQRTGEFIAKKLGVDIEYTPWVDPFVPIAKCWKVIKQTATKMKDDEELVVVSHGPLINELVAWLLDSGEGDKFHFAHGSIAHFDTDDPAPGNGFPIDGRGENVVAIMHWMVTPKLMNRAMELDNEAVIEEAIRIAESILKEYSYDIENVKRSVPDDDACEMCQDEADEGWIGDDEVFPNSGEDAPPFHPNCKCQIEYKEKRVRVDD